MISKKYYTVRDLMTLLQVSRRSIYRWIKEKNIGTTRFGLNELRFSEEQLAAFLRTRNTGVKADEIWEDPEPDIKSGA